VLLIHAMLELPHGYAVFLLPAGLMMGLVEAHSGARSVLVLPRWAAAASVLGLAAALGMLANEYRDVERDLLALRMRAARIANLPDLGPAPELKLMAPIGDVLASLRIDPEPGLNDASMDRLRRVAYHFPSTGNLLRFAQASALNGRPVQAFEALRLLCQLRPLVECNGVAQVWRERGRAYPALAEIEPPDPPSGSVSVTGTTGTMRSHGANPQ
jgi:hypothetical protein